MSPDKLILYVFGLSVFVAFLNIESWGDISITTFVVILVALLMFEFGASIPRSKHRGKNISFPDIIPSKAFDISVIAFMALVTYMQFIDLSKLVGKGGIGVFAISLLVRDGLYSDYFTINHPFFVWQGLYASRALSYIYLYVICYQKIIKGDKIKLILVIPIIIYCIQIILSTGRSDFIYLFYAALMITSILIKYKSGMDKTLNLGFIKYMLLALFAFLSLFLYISSARHDGDIDVARTLSIYLGSSISAFDMYLNTNGLESTASFFGEQTQLFLYSVARTLKLTDVSGVSTLPPCSLAGDMTNIYTCLYRYTHDYGAVIMFIILFFLGFFYMKLFNRIYRNKNSLLNLLMYSYLSYPLIEFSIEERFMTTLISARTIYVCMYIYLFYRFLVVLSHRK